jgi:hypothetical protein
MRLRTLIVALCALGCHSSDLRGPGPGYPPAVGVPGSRVAEMPPARNSFSNYGWGSAYDPHPPGSLATPGTPSETGSLPPFPYWHPYFGVPVGAPPPVYDQPRR